MYIKEDGETGKEYGEDAELLAQAEDLFTINREFPSQGFVTLRKEEPHMGRLQDDFGVKLSADVGKGFDHVPLYTVTNYLDELVRVSTLRSMKCVQEYPSLNACRNTLHAFI